MGIEKETLEFSRALVEYQNSARYSLYMLGDLVKKSNLIVCVEDDVSEIESYLFSSNKGLFLLWRIFKQAYLQATDKALNLQFSSVSTEASVIMEYLVNISKRRAFWSLNEDIIKITMLTTNTLYPSRKIQRIRDCTHQKTTKERNSIRRIQKNSIRRIEDIVCEDSGRYQTWRYGDQNLSTAKESSKAGHNDSNDMQS
ncbi:hypothetical protein Tco_0707732 [Tanacetum coccineum]